MVYLIDTNILLRFVDRTHPLHPIIRTAIRKLRRDGNTLQITVQNCVEFWNVATRPATKNGFGLTPTDADASVLKAKNWEILTQRFPVPTAPPQMVGVALTNLPNQPLPLDN